MQNEWSKYKALVWNFQDRSQLVTGPEFTGLQTTESNSKKTIYCVYEACNGIILRFLGSRIGDRHAAALRHNTNSAN